MLLVADVGSCTSLHLLFFLRQGQVDVSFGRYSCVHVIWRGWIWNCVTGLDNEVKMSFSQLRLGLRSHR